MPLPLVENIRKSRTRERGLFYPATQTGQWYNSTQVPRPAPTVYTITDSRGTREKMTDVVTTAFKRLSGEGEIVNNNMSYWSQTRTCNTSGPMFQNVQPGITYVGDLQGPHWTQGRLTSPDLPVNRWKDKIDLQPLINLAATRAMAGIDQPQFEGATSLLEAKETLRYLRNPVASGIKLADTLAALSRKHGLTRGFSGVADARKLPRDVLKDLASIYLSIIFGFKPVVQEVVGALENLRPVNTRGNRKTSRSKEIKQVSDTWTVNETFSGITYSATYVWTQTVTVSVGYLYAYKDAVLSEEQWGLRPRDFAAAAWATMSKSFVIDWFVNFGEFISALTPSANTRILSSWMTITTVTKLSRSVGGYVLPVAGWSTVRDGSGEESVITITKDRTVPAPPPSLAWRGLGSLENDKSKLLTLIALLTGTLKSAGNPPIVPKKTRTGRTLQPDAWY